MSLDLIERADRPLNRAACALYDAVGWLEPRIRRLEDDELVANLIRAAIRRVRAFRRVAS